MNFVDLFSLTLHRAVAARMLSDERRVLKAAKSNVDRWLSHRDSTDEGSEALLEWKAILENSTPNEIIRIISEDSHEGQRLRSSSPFSGILTQNERKEIFDACAEIVPV